MSNLSSFIDATSLNLYSSAVSLHGDGNILLSPLSIIYASLLVYLGARGNTKTNLDAAFKFNSYFKGDELLDSFSGAIPDMKDSSNKSALQFLSESDKMQLALANGIFLQQRFMVRQDYLSNVVESLRASLNFRNFINDSETARRDINRWAEERTGGKIHDLIPPGGVDFETRLVLANALYFKAPWNTKFDASKTRKGPFTLLNGKSNRVDFMRIKQMFNYVEDPQLNVQYLEIPYIWGDASLLVVLPRDPAGLRKLEANMTAEDLKRLGSSANDAAMIDVSLPKFKVESSFNVVELLQKIGVSDVFLTSADLSGITARGTGQLFVSSAFHKTFIDLNEKGTEAAAATAVAVASRSSFLVDPKEAPIRFVADHPFIYAIRHNPSGLILFIGRIENL